MDYVLLDEQGEIAQYPYSIWHLRRDNPDTSFPTEPGPDCLAEFRVAAVTLTEAPETTYAERIESAPPKLIDGEWLQQWSIVDVPIEEIRAAIRPVTPLQMRRALRVSGLKAGVDAFLSEAGDEAQEAWEYAVEIRRDDQLVNMAATALGKSQDELDELFRLAATMT